MRQIKKGSTDRSVIIRIIDSTDGSPETGVVYNTSGIDLWYRREGAAVTSITEAELAALTTAHTDGGIIHIGNGYYRLDLPDAAWATGANHVMVGGTVTGMIVIGQEIQLVNFDPEDGVRLGLTALPNADADAAGGLPISDAGGLDLDAKLANTNEVTAARMGALTDWINGGRLDLILDAIAGDVVNLDGAAMRGTDGAALASAWTATRAGYVDLLNTYLDAAISSRLASSGYTAPDNASITSILEDTGATIPAQINGLNNLSSAQAQSAATAALMAYDPPTKAEMDAGHALLATAASIAALNNISTAQVLAQATAALEATITEPTDLTDLSAKGILYHLFSRFFHRNTQTATAQVTYKANGTTALATRTASDNGTTQELGKAI